MNNILSVPAKTTVPLDLSEPLQHVIEKEFYQPPSKFADDIEQFGQLRQPVVHPQPTMECVSAVKKYYVQLASLRSRIPDDSIAFTWSPLFDSSHPHSAKSLLFEQCNVLLLVGSLYSQLAKTQNRYSGEGLKKAGVYFQYAAGCFQVLQERESFTKSLSEIPLDMRTAPLSALTYLMLAAAQEIYWLKAVTDNLKDTVVSKLSMQVAEFYHAAGLFIDRSEGVFPKEWTQFCTLKTLHFKAASFYRLAVHAGLQDNHGEEVGRLRQTCQLTQEAQKVKLKGFEQVTKDLQNLAAVAAEDLRKAERENDLLYLQEVPEDLAEPTKATLVKPMILQELSSPLEVLPNGDYGASLFGKLIPHTVIEQASSFKERILAYVQERLVEPVQVLDSLLDQFVAETNLDTEMDSLLKPQTVPESGAHHAQSIREMGGMANLDSMMGRLNSLKLNCQQDLETCWKLLRRAEDDNKSLRALYGAKRWTLASVTDQAADVVNSLTGLQQYMDQSKEGDETIFVQLEQLRAYVDVYEDDTTLEEFVPKADVVALNPELRDLVVEMKQQAAALESMRQERAKFVQNVTHKVDSVDMLDKVVEKYRSSTKFLTEDDYEPILENEMAAFQSDAAFVASTSKAQEQTVSNLRKNHVKLASAKNTLKVSPEREKALDVLGQTYSGYCEVVGNIKQGLSFYSDFHTQLDAIHNELTDYLEERRHASVELQHRLDEMDQML